MKIHLTKAPTFTKAIIATAVFTVIYLASSSSLPSCSDTAALLNSTGECIERQSFLHTGSGWLALISLIAAVLLLALKYKDSLLGRQAQVSPSLVPPVHEASSAPAREPAPGFCRKCGTRIIAGDRFCQGCGVSMESLPS